MANQATDKKLQYRWPSWVSFVAAIVGMGLVTDLAFATGSNTTNFDRDVLGNGLPAHWAYIKALSGGFINLEAVQRFSYHIWADHTTGSSVVTFWIAILAWAVHVLETIFAVRKCIRLGASAGVTVLYGIGVFLGGITQFTTLNAEARRVGSAQTTKQK